MFFIKKNKKKYKTYYYEIFQDIEDEKPSLEGLNKFFESIEKDDVNIYFRVCSSIDYDNNFQLLDQRKKERIYLVKNLKIDYYLFDCMFGCIYVSNKKVSPNDFLVNNREKYLVNMIAELQINDIFECSLEVKEHLKDNLLELVKRYGDSESKIKTKFYKY